MIVVQIQIRTKSGLIGPTIVCRDIAELEQTIEMTKASFLRLLSGIPDDKMVR